MSGNRRQRNRFGATLPDLVHFSSPNDLRSLESAFVHRFLGDSVEIPAANIFSADRPGLHPIVWKWEEHPGDSCIRDERQLAIYSAQTQRN